jgi:hypothetical protein
VARWPMRSSTVSVIMVVGMAVIGRGADCFASMGRILPFSRQLVPLCKLSTGFPNGGGGRARMESESIFDCVDL